MGVYDDGFDGGSDVACQVIATAIREWKPETNIPVDIVDALRDSLTDFIGDRIEDTKRFRGSGYLFKAIVNDTPMKWKKVDEARYDEMLNILPPATMTGFGFLVGEPWDHHPIKGHPRFAALIQCPLGFFEGTRPIGIKDFRNFDMMSVPANIVEGDG